MSATLGVRGTGHGPLRVAMREPREYARARTPRMVERLREFVAIPSVSSDPRHKGDVARCADWLARHLAGIGLERSRVIRTAGHPLVYAEWRHAPGRATLLVYGHYDVQPAGPASAWERPPFEPVVRDGWLLGRGADDDKGQLFAHLAALESMLRGRGRLPVNVQCIFEGEEETGGPALGEWVRGAGGRALAPNVAVISDMSMRSREQPALTYGLRGTLNLEVELKGPAKELHSGTYGGAVANPLQAACGLVARLHDRDGRIAIPGFYDRVRRVPAAERELMRRSGPPDEELLREAGGGPAAGERGFSAYERTTIRPALSVTGIAGGHAGPGVKTVVPPDATVKINVRLVPDQNPDEIAGLIRAYLPRLVPRGVRVRVHVRGTAQPTLTDREHPAARAAARAFGEGFGAEPVFVRSGGSIGAAELFQSTLRVPTLLMGYGLPEGNRHAPNERLHLPTWQRCVTTSIRLAEELGRWRV